MKEKEERASVGDRIGSSSFSQLSTQMGMNQRAACGPSDLQHFLSDLIPLDLASSCLSFPLGKRNANRKRAGNSQRLP